MVKLTSLSMIIKICVLHGVGWGVFGLFEGLNVAVGLMEGCADG